MRRLMSRGLTLVELVVTISLAAILGIPVGMLLSEQLRGALEARDVAVATQLARYELELLDSFNDFCHSRLALGTTTIDPYQGSPYALTRIVTCRTGGTTCDACPAPPSDAQNAVKQIGVRVTKSGSTGTLVLATTYRTKYALFGP